MAENQEKNDDLFFKPSRYVLILRRNLMASSALVLMALAFDLGINESKIFGGAITGLTKEEIYYAAFILLFYFTGHFILSYLNELREWRFQLFKWSSDYKDADSKKAVPYSIGFMRSFMDQTYLVAQANPKMHGNAKNRLRQLRKEIKIAEKFWRLQLDGFEIGLPIAMGALAMAWLGWLIIA